MIGAQAEAGVVEEDAGEEEARRPGVAVHRAQRRRSHQAAHQRRDPQEPDHEDGELQVRGELDVIDDAPAREEERPGVEEAGEVRRGADEPPLGEPLHRAHRGVVLGDAEVLPARVEGDVVGREDREVDGEEAEQPEGVDEQRPGGRPRRAPPGAAEVAGRAARIAEGGERPGGDQRQRQGEEEHAPVEPEQAAQHGAEEEEVHPRRERHREVLEERQHPLAEGAPEQGVAAGEAGRAEEQREQPVGGVADEEPVGDGVVPVDQRAEAHRGRGEHQREPHPPDPADPLGRIHAAPALRSRRAPRARCP